MFVKFKNSIQMPHVKLPGQEWDQGFDGGVRKKC